MKWFAVTYIYKIICGEGSHSPQFNEQTRLLSALNLKSALKKANLNAQKFNVPFTNCEGKLVKWKFIAVASIYEIEAPEDGVEVNAKIVEPQSVDSYLKKLGYRKKSLINQILP